MRSDSSACLTAPCVCLPLADNKRTTACDYDVDDDEERGSERRRVTSEFRRQAIQPLRGWRKTDGATMSPDKQSVGSPSPAPTTTDHNTLIHTNSNSHSSDSSSSAGGSNCSTSGPGTSLSNSRSPTAGDRNNNLHSNHNHNNTSGSVPQSNPVLHLTPHSVIQAGNQQSVIISTTAAAGVVQVCPHALVLRSHSLLLPQHVKHVLVNTKHHHPGSVIQSTGESEVS